MNTIVALAVTLTASSLGGVQTGLAQGPGAQRAGQHFTQGHEPGLGRLERALSLVLAARPLQARLKDAIRQGKVAPIPVVDLAARSEAAGVLTGEEARLWQQAVAARADAVSVDAVPAASRETVPVA